MLEQTGRRHSELLREQRSQEGGSRIGGPLRFPDCLVLWVKCEQDILDRRCDKRVDKMIERGMVKELEDFHKVRAHMGKGGEDSKNISFPGYIFYP